MSLKTLSLGGLDFTETPGDLQYVTLRTGPGDTDWVNILLSDLRTFITADVNARVDTLSDQVSGGSAPSIWPALRTMTLSGVVAGSVAFDGSADFTLNATMADGALTIAKTSGLQAILDSLASKDNPNFAGTVTLAGDMLPDADNIRSLGSPTLMWKDVYIGPGSLYINGQKVLEDNAGTIRMLADPDQNIAIQTAGSCDIELAPTGTGVIQLKGTLTLLGGSKIRSSNGTALLFDDAISFTDGAGFVGPISIDGNDIWHQGNFDPSTKATLGSSANFSALTVNSNNVWHAGNFDPATTGYLTVAAVLHGPDAGVNCDTFAPGTKKLVHNTNSNTPSTSTAYWYIETLQTGTDATTLLQRAYSTTADEVYIRRCSGGVWTSWRRQWNSSNFDPTSKLDSNGVAASAVKLQTARSFALTGLVTAAPMNFDGAGNVSLTTDIADAALSMAKVSGLSTALSGKLSTGTAFYDAFGNAPTAAAAGADADNFAVGSRYYMNQVDGVLNTPTVGTWYIETTNMSVGSGRIQEATNSDGERYFRTRWIGWGAWRKVYHSGNLDLATFNAASATKLQTARSIGLVGTVTGSANFDGSAGISINTTIADGALSIPQVAGLQDALDAAGGSGGGITWQVVEAGNVATAVSQTGYLMRCAGGLYQVTLPTGVPIGFEVTVKAIGGQVRIVSNGNTITGIAAGSDLLLEDGDVATLVGSAVGELSLLWANNSLTGTTTELAPGYVSIPTSEDLDAGDLVNIYDNAGTPIVRKADATAYGKEAHGFVLAASVAPAAALVRIEGRITGLSGLMPGAAMYLDTVAGGYTSVAPSAPGNVVQHVGRAMSATEIQFNPQPPIELV